MHKKKRILLVDDEEEIRCGVRMWLNAAGYETTMAGDGVEAIEVANAFHPDAIVMDVRMPRKDGLKAMSELKMKESTQHIPIVMLSASIVDQEIALDGGASYFLTKPYQGRAVVDAVNTAINKMASPPGESTLPIQRTNMIAVSDAAISSTGCS